MNDLNSVESFELIEKINKRLINLKSPDLNSIKSLYYSLCELTCEILKVQSVSIFTHNDEGNIRRSSIFPFSGASFQGS